MSKFRSSLYRLLAVLCLLSSLANAQAVSGNILGTVYDASGATVPNAKITIRDLDRGTTDETSTNAEGNYSQTRLLAVGTR